MSQEGLLWKTALRHLGASDLRQVVAGLWVEARPAPRATVEYLDAGHVSDEVLNILRGCPSSSRRGGAPQGG